MLNEIALETLQEYVRIGRPTGGFLEAVIANDLMNAFGSADCFNQEIMIEYVRYVYSKMPRNCHGSYEVYVEWIKAGGLEGQARKREERRENIEENEK